VLGFEFFKISLGLHLWNCYKFHFFIVTQLHILINQNVVGEMNQTGHVHVCCLHFKMEFRSCSRVRQWCGIIHYYWWKASIKPRLLFSRAGYAFWGLSLSSVYVKHLTPICNPVVNKSVCVQTHVLSTTNYKICLD